MSGFLDLEWWKIVIATLVLTHLTIISVTIYLHRHQTHGALKLRGIAAHPFRLWLWLTTGMVTKEWVAAHRMHHQKCETLEDPHSPVAQMKTHGIEGGWKKLRFMLEFVFIRGVRSYVVWTKGNPETVERLGATAPRDWIERHLYSKHTKLGIVLMAIIDVLCFGLVPGFFVWGVQMLWIPVLAAGFINGVGHVWGYRNYRKLRDFSRNILPWGIVIGGEELHNNHHGDGSSAKLSRKWWEFDIGWFYIRLLAWIGAAYDVRT